MLIKTQKQLDQLVADLTAATAGGAPLAFDTEFLSEKRYYAKLCLVQVLAPLENGGVVEGAVDPFGLDLSELARMISDPNIVKIVHSGSADLLILWQLFETQGAQRFRYANRGGVFGLRPPDRLCRYGAAFHRRADF